MAPSVSDTPPPPARSISRPSQNHPSPSSPHPLLSRSTGPALPSPRPPAPRSSKRRPLSLPFSFPLLSQPNTSSASLLPSTAEGRPIPLDDSTAAHRTSALRELNRSQPSSRHRYTKSSGASSPTGTTTGTYSQPVVVRTYSGPSPAASAGRPVGRRIPLSSPSTSAGPSPWRSGQNGMVLSMARYRGSKSKTSQSGESATLPPVDAFSFKGIMQDVQQDIGAELDRIAEICARSRYSLSNQYEVHITPHGSGAGFLASAPGSSRQQQAPGGPTLQAIPSDDEHSGMRHKKRRIGLRRKSVAYGTLETIMSSSRSSDEDKSKKKSAAEIAEEVRGRAQRSKSGGNSPNAGSGEAASQPQEVTDVKDARRKSASFATAVMENTRTQAQGDSASPRTSGTALVSGPAKPKTSRSHLEIRTVSEDPSSGNYTREPPQQPPQVVISDSVAAAAIANPEEPRAQWGLLDGLSSWWKGPVVMERTSSDKRREKPQSYAAGSLRELLKSTDSTADTKGKCVDRQQE